MFDVAVDIRQGSPTFGQWAGATLDEQSMRMMYVPPGFAHGFVTLTDTADFIYKCTNYYHPASEHGILWNDSKVGIDWPTTDVKLSDKDLNNPTLENHLPANLPTFSSL